MRSATIRRESKEELASQLTVVRAENSELRQAVSKRLVGNSALLSAIGGEDRLFHTDGIPPAPVACCAIDLQTRQDPADGSRTKRIGALRFIVQSATSEQLDGVGVSLSKLFSDWSYDGSACALQQCSADAAAAYTTVGRHGLMRAEWSFSLEVKAKRHAS